MAKKFTFEDEEVQEKTTQTKQSKDNKVPLTNQKKQGKSNPKKNKTQSKRKLKWWHYCLIVFVILVVVFGIYLIKSANNDGPVYGNRCEGLVELPKDNMTATETAMKEKYSEISEISFEIACKQLKLDIVYKDKMDTKKAKSIAEEAVQYLDKQVGKEKEKDATYSNLFGTINGQLQYEVNLYLVSNDSKDFPIYGTMSSKTDKFSYTYASVKDEKSKKEAEETLKEKKEE